MALEDSIPGFNMEVLRKLRMAAKHGLGSKDRAESTASRPLPTYDFSGHLGMKALQAACQAAHPDQASFPPTSTYFMDTQPSFTQKQREQLKAMGFRLTDALVRIVRNYGLTVFPLISDGLSLAGIVFGHNSYAEQLEHLRSKGLTQGEQGPRHDVLRVFEIRTSELRDTLTPRLFGTNMSPAERAHGLNCLLALNTGFLLDGEVPSPGHPRMEFPTSSTPNSVVTLTHPDPRVPFRVVCKTQTPDHSLPHPLTRSFSLRFRG
ncbi:hypothetical protein A2631_00600 [Candidatus Daviesbacteria bacterium RIFCSPHIGHO2_01_FULL_44_29]|uniref:Uncharacterized protein n=1 Tax=Candidatus Daviesbacteria bacterium RIFCSPHIGHO2_02_FULL_43_12 TaxID=1797776 RepID=A0A1F5KHQ5_9BACT|nr:MAG: hypothetical protein A2631_00600 [Candidatus Daviesbacteria bacterium RIFCSPHIGHO2_01_FULL_44_29]OGE39436.1 MAG: hypothetical protein A3E86_01460 [Candidatus Daviesbacteria bacterium RIFCSPHIGHO2_12_FULL_47_45]OGE40335.1 MAG: hypothetical protein A3D25_03060 [Candidatus Daviesbacteria bacterium RIFCSPHIGHO2_02_FULL_43_12]OGE69746.1 MAG: hypothetical protein A3B55_02145 [Candidatus Daviesbacteria bacterium RIFCSPLOWO2_01_FULL_43_15]